MEHENTERGQVKTAQHVELPNDVTFARQNEANTSRGQAMLQGDLSFPCQGENMARGQAMTEGDMSFTGQGVPQNNLPLPGDAPCEDGSLRKSKFAKKSDFVPVKIINPEEVNRDGLLVALKARFQRKAKKWEKLAIRYSRCSFAMTFLILVLQVGQMIVLSMKSAFIPEQYFTIVTACVTALSALLAGLQLKLKLHEKGERLKKGVRIYNKLLRSTSYYIMMEENGGIPEDYDTVMIWEHALHRELDDIPIVRTMLPI